MEFYTERLHLRKWNEIDAVSLYQCASDPDVGPSCGWCCHKSIHESKAVIANVLTGDECYAVCDKVSDTPIGCIDLKKETPLTHSRAEREIGFWLGKPFWGQGYMKEAVEVLIAHAFDDLGLTTIWCGHFDDNFRSARVQQKLGFEGWGVIDEFPVPLLGKTCRLIVNRMTREMYERK